MARRRCGACGAGAARRGAAARARRRRLGVAIGRLRARSDRTATLRVAMRRIAAARTTACATAGPHSIKAWPSHERPREKLLDGGADRLTDAELLAVALSDRRARRRRTRSTRRAPGCRRSGRCAALSTRRSARSATTPGHRPGARRDAAGGRRAGAPLRAAAAAARHAAPHQRRGLPPLRRAPRGAPQGAVPRHPARRQEPAAQGRAGVGRDAHGVAGPSRARCSCR